MLAEGDQPAGLDGPDQRTRPLFNKTLHLSVHDKVSLQLLIFGISFRYPTKIEHDSEREYSVAVCQDYGIING